MVYPQIPLPIVIALPFIFILFLLSGARYDLNPKAYIGHSTTIAGLTIGFVFLYALQKYDTMDGNYPVIVRNIIYLSDVSAKYNISTICYLIQYLNDYLTFNNSGYPLIMYERNILGLVADQEAEGIQEAVEILQILFHDRISRTNFIAAPVWYVVFVISILLTIILALDTKFRSIMDSIIVIIFIWFPIVVIYAMYIVIQNDVDVAIQETIDSLQRVANENGQTCTISNEESRNNSNITPRNPISF